jgi:hypothetical protein
VEFKWGQFEPQSILMAIRRPLLPALVMDDFAMAPPKDAELYRVDRRM